MELKECDKILLAHLAQHKGLQPPEHVLKIGWIPWWYEGGWVSCYTLAEELGFSPQKTRAILFRLTNKNILMQRETMIVHDNKQVKGFLWKVHPHFKEV